MISTDAKELVTSLGGAQGALNLMLGDRSPRRLGMLIAALIGATFGLAAARNWWLSRRRAVRPVRLPRTASSPMPAEPTRRRGSRSGVLQRVHALAAKGSTSMEIARDTGLPSDAVALLLAMTEGQQQRPRTAA
jgi:hypothetical protein